MSDSRGSHSVLDRIDLVCDAFEEALRAGRHPVIEDYLHETDLPDPSTLFFELVAVEVEYRRTHGEFPTLGEYARRFPEFVHVLSDLLLGADLPETVVLRTASQGRGLRGTRLGRYELEDPVGAGAFGVVYRARDVELGRTVAIKVPHRGSIDEKEREFVLREARAAANVRHPNLVTLLDLDRDGDRTFLVSEFIDGVNLKTWLEGRQVDPRQAADICATIAEALHSAHAQRIYHRDVKPGNIVLDHDGQPHVLDFGLAKQLAEDGTLTVGGEPVGTPAYMSPEQARGRMHEIDARSDLFSVGIVLYEMLAGRRPFEGSTAGLQYQIIHDDPPPLRSLVPTVPRDLETICVKALQKEQSARYATAADFAADLRRFLAGEPIKARPVGLLERAWRWARKHRAAALSMCLLAPVSAFAVYGWTHRAPPVARPERTVLLATEPNGATVVFVPIDAATGEPLPEKMIRPEGLSPLRCDLLPGDYLVVANRDDVGWHEVLRRVPGPDEPYGVPFGQKHLHWKKLPDESFELKPVTLFPAAASEGMVRIEGHPAFRAPCSKAQQAKPLLAGEHSVPSFFMDSTEVTTGDWEQRGFAGPDKPPPSFVPRLVAVSKISFDRALAYAEARGARLPEGREFLLAATEGGKPWIPKVHDKPLPPPPYEVGGDPLDVIPTSPPLLGLRSNVAEWTLSRIGGFDAGVPQPKPRYMAEPHLVLGGVPVLSESDPRFGKEDDYDPCLFRPMMRSMPPEGVGFRCVRSAKPRLRPEDFRYAPPAAE